MPRDEQNETRFVTPEFSRNSDWILEYKNFNLDRQIGKTVQNEWYYNFLGYSEIFLVFQEAYK